MAMRRGAMGRKLAVALTAVAGVAGCSAVYENHGYVPQAGALAEVRQGVDTRSSVQRKVGRPGTTGVFTDDGWYYVGYTVERLTWNEPEVVDRQVVAILFDETDVVASVARFGLEDGQVVDLVTRRTPTFGAELGILEQILGNIGNVQATDLVDP